MTTIQRTIAVAGVAALCARVAFAQAPAPAPPKPADFARDAYVIEQLRTIYRFENDGTGRRQSYTRVKVQSDAGVEVWGQLVFPYNAANERLAVDFVRVKKADGASIAAGPDAVQDLSSAVQREAPVYTDTREKHITVPGLRPGDTLEISLSAVIETPLARGHFWMDHDFVKTGIVLDESLVVDVPAGRTVIVKTRPGMDAKVSDEGGRRVYEWNTARLADDDPKAKRKAAASEERAAVRMTTFTTWQELGDWYRGLERPQRASDSEIRTKASELTAGRRNETEKLQALYEFVAGNFAITWVRCTRSRAGAQTPSAPMHWRCMLNGPTPPSGTGSPRSLEAATM